MSCVALEVELFCSDVFIVSHSFIQISQYKVQSTVRKSLNLVKVTGIF